MTRKKNIHAIANPKGGVAKSTSAANVASISASQGFKTLLIDLDPQGSASYLLGYEDDNSVSSSMLIQKGEDGKQAQASKIAINLKKYLLDNGADESDISTPFFENLDFIPAGPNLIATEDYISSQPLGESLLMVNLSKDIDLDQYDYIFLDCPGYAGRLYTSILFATDFVYVPVKPSTLSSKEIPGLLKTIEVINNQRFMNGPVDVVALFFVDCDDRTNATKLNMELIKEDEFGLLKEFGIRVSESFIPSSKKYIEEAALIREPVVVSFPDSKPAQSYVSLFREVFQR